MTNKKFPFAKAQEIDFMDPIVQENWFDAYDLIREESPAYFMPQIGMYVLTRYADIEHVLRHPKQFTSSRDTEPLIKFDESLSLYEEKGWPRIQPLSLNVPKHSHFRKLVDPALTAGAIKKKKKRAESETRGAVFLAPIANDADYVVYLGILRRLSEHGDHVPERFRLLLARDDLLEDADARAALSVPILGIRVEALEDVERLARVIKRPRAITLVRDDAQERERVVVRLQTGVQLPRQLRLTVVNVRLRQPRQVGVFPAIPLVAHGLERLLGGFVIARRRVRDASTYFFIPFLEFPWSRCRWRADMEVFVFPFFLVNIG